MAATPEAQQVHDQVLQLIREQGLEHEPCFLCAAPDAEIAKEAAAVADDRTFTEAEHFALLTDAVKRETAAVTTERDELKDKLASAEQRVDVLEAEKAAAVAERDQVKTEFEAFKAEITEKAQVAERKADRLARVKAAADYLDDKYFTDARVQRWAEMADEQFEATLSDLIEARPAGSTSATAKTPVETAAFAGGASPKSTDGAVSTAARLLGFRTGAPVGTA